MCNSFNKETEAQSNLQQALSYDEAFWKQKSSLNWFTYGDRKIVFFHIMAKI
jgi:monoamine oxidase